MFPILIGSSMELSIAKNAKQSGTVSAANGTNCNILAK